MPEYVNAWLGGREQTVLRHGFTESQLALGWWRRTLTDLDMGHIEVSVDPRGNGANALTRGDLFELGRHVATDQDALTFLVHVLAWGSGVSTRNNRRRLEAFSAGAARTSNLSLLRGAVEHAQSGSPDAAREAYALLIRRGGGAIHGLGPAFFTKLLYFAGRGEGAVPCLILDARVASNLYKAGWESLPFSQRRGGKNFSFNWYADTYASYCELLAAWAAAAESRTHSDEIERALFAGAPAPAL